MPNSFVTPFFDPEFFPLPVLSPEDGRTIVEASNAAFAERIEELRSLLGVNIVEFDSFSFQLEVEHEPAAFGITEVGFCVDYAAPLVVDTVCANPSSRAFFDAVHPSSTTHRAYGQRVLAALGVAEPETMALLGLAAGIVPLAGRIRRGRVTPSK